MRNDECVREEPRHFGGPRPRDDGADVIVKSGPGGFVRINGAEIPCVRSVDIAGRPGEMLGVTITIMPRSLQVL